MDRIDGAGAGLPPLDTLPQLNVRPLDFFKFLKLALSMMAVVEVLVAKSCHSGPIRVSAGIVGARAGRLGYCSRT